MLCLSAAIEISSHSPTLSSRDNVGDVAVNGDGQPGPIMRAERQQATHHAREKHPDGGTPEVDAAASAVQMLASGAMCIVGETVPPSDAVLSSGARRIFDESPASPPLREIELVSPVRSYEGLQSARKKLVSPQTAPAAQAPTHPPR